VPVPDRSSPDAPSLHPSDAPQRQSGTHTRSGNAMLRTRAAILEAAGRRLGSHGVRPTTMADLAYAAGIAKATLYNHFRTKPDVLSALVDDQVALLAAEGTVAAQQLGESATAEERLAAALTGAAITLGTHPALRRITADEPGVLLPLLVPGEGRGWFQARAAVGDVLVVTGLPAVPDAVELVLRWLVSQLMWPVDADAAAGGAALLAAGIATAEAPAELQPAPGEPGEDAGHGAAGMTA
jgi:AcrR family transcriptional regulator